jgi:uncharacterized protein YraI
MNTAVSGPLRLASILAALLLANGPASATADGPDHYRVQAVAKGSFLNLRAEPSTASPRIGRIPADARCLRNLGCRIERDLRWCKVEFQGATGWVAGAYLAEGACKSAQPAARAGSREESRAGSREESVAIPRERDSVALKGRIKGQDFVDYLVRAGAGQTLAVGLAKSNPRNHFNVIAPGAEAAMFVGSSPGEFSGVVPVDGEYTVRVYLAPAAARRNESSDYTLTVGVTGKALPPLVASQDILIPGTPYHATATIACVPPAPSDAKSCEAWIVRRGFDGTATVEVRLGYGFRRWILFVAGKPVASDAAGPIAVSGQAGLSIVRLGAGERYEVPEALLKGG